MKDIVKAWNNALTFLYDRIDYERNDTPQRVQSFKLNRMHELMRRLGNPQQHLRIIHVAGTKGKGSTAHMTASVLKAAGLRCGLYTSPHLETLEERFVVDGAPCQPASQSHVAVALHCPDFVALTVSCLLALQLVPPEHHVPMPVQLLPSNGGGGGVGASASTKLS